MKRSRDRKREIVTGCACGMACGSWDIRAETTCHCQCSNIDWTSARCCKIEILYGSV
uniref:Uncharacterized protein n=1 Tax=Sphenodon punctatus TaxID=8508 RepID=A0A8D0G8U0_SPHPU